MNGPTDLDGPPSRRVAVVGNSEIYAGPALARALAARGHDLVLGDPGDELLAELEGRGRGVEVVAACSTWPTPGRRHARRRRPGRFGRIDAAVAFTGSSSPAGS